MKIIKSNGITEGEKLVAELCEKSFLKLWSYANLYKEPGKELCDNFILFGNTIILISEKTKTPFEYDHNLHKDDDNKEIGQRYLDILWKRWSKEIKSSEDQLNGAERWIKKHPDKIFIDSKCLQKFPLELPNINNIKFIKISVINGLDKVNKLREQYNNGELDYDLPEDMFLFGINLENIIHLLDDYTFPIVMKELDTISDFINFFQKKEEFLKSQKFPVGILDLDLLPIYLLDIDPMTCCFSFKQLETMSNQYDTVLFGNTVDPYPDFCKEEYYKNLKKDLKSSYLWDYLIDSCAQDALDDLLVEQQDINDTNKTLKIMAEEPRLSRKYISEAYLETIDTFNNNASHRGRAVQSPYNKEIMYVFLQVKRQDGEDYTDYRKQRRAFATVYCNVINANHPCIKYVVAIVSEPVKYNLYLSRDFILYPFEPLSDEEKKNILKIQKDLNVLQITRNMKSKDTHTSKVGRNDKCPCGSGLKYKKCCLNK